MSDFLNTLIFSAELGGAPELDLHGLDTATALDELERFLHANFYHKERIVKVIHGRGTGKLQRSIQTWLTKERRLVEAWRDSTRLEEAGAVTYVVLKER